jgi:hypothetical protein
MAASPIETQVIPRTKWRRWSFVLAAPFVGVAGVSWWLTEPLEDPVSESPARVQATAPASAIAAERPLEISAEPTAPPPWPEGRLEGRQAKTLLLQTLLDVERRLDQVDGYTAIFRKQERIGGVLLPEQTLAMKVRNDPFAIYLKFLAPTKGKEVVYAEGHHDNKVIAHSTGVSRWLVPRLAVPPDHPLALADNRHAVTEAGLANLTRRLVAFRRLDLDDPQAVTILDRTSDADGSQRLRSIHTHPTKTPARPFARVEVLYDPASRLPLCISNFDWPEPDHQGDLLLAERYVYDELNLTAPLSALDFDPANPAYSFHRY